MIAHLVASTGWTWEFVTEEVTLPMMTALGKYWKSYPPVHMLVAAYMGIEPEVERGTLAEKEKLIAELQNVPGGKVIVNG